MNGPMQLVLNYGEKAFGGLSGYIIVDGCGINIGDLLVKLALAQAYFPDALQLLFKIFFTKNGAIVL